MTILLYIIYSNTLSVLRIIKVAIGTIKGLEANNHFDNYSAATSVSKNFTKFASSVTPITSLCTSSSVAGSMAL